MTFKEFDEWCNARACDGMWGIDIVIRSGIILDKMFKTPIWRRRKKWKEFEAEASYLVELCRQHYCGAKMNAEVHDADQ
jgi:hypothetical protein